MFSVCLSVDFVVWGEEGPYENQNCAKCELKIYGNEKTTYVRKITKLNHPPHSPDLASCEWNFFGFIPGTFYQISYCTQSTNPTTFANRNPRPSRRRELAASKLTQTHKNRDRPDKKKTKQKTRVVLYVHCTKCQTDISTRMISYSSQSHSRLCTSVPTGMTTGIKPA